MPAYDDSHSLRWWAKEPARVLRRRSVLVDRLSTWAQLELLIRRENPILVYSMGKAGTTSLTNALEALTGRPVLKAHTLDRSEIRQRIETDRRERGLERAHFWWRGEWIAINLRLSRNRPWDVITAVREPIARAASAYFYNIQVRVEAGKAAQPSADPEAHIAAIADFALGIGVRRDWFRNELEPTTGIDVYSEPFPTAQGYQSIQRERFALLVLRYENLRDAAPTALQEFLSTEQPVELPSANVGSTRTAGPYANFLTDGRLPASVVEQVYSSTFSRHFYSAAERERFCSRWTR